MNVPKTLLAKCPRDGHTIDLASHATQVADAARLLFGSENKLTALGRAWLRFFKVKGTMARRFVRSLAAACIFHDLGKANPDFQDALRRRAEQAYRHEHLSALVLDDPRVRKWMNSIPEFDSDAVIGAVLAHHLKASPGSLERQIEDDRRVPLFLTHDQVSKCFAVAAKRLGVHTRPTFQENLNCCDESLRPRFQALERRAHAFRKALKKGDQRHRLLLAVKAGLVAADAAGSALARENLPISQWIDGCFSSGPLKPEWIDQNIIQPRIAEIRRVRGSFEWKDFQNAAGNLGPRAVLLSSCGSGKTLAAWRWIRNQLSKRNASRVVFLYPTRATATEGFKDYVSWADKEAAALLHGTSSFDLRGMFANTVDPRAEREYQVNERLFALGYWPRRVFSATVDSFLGFMRNQYASICMLPALCDSVAVIDEVHSFDRAMFSALERFLEFFDIPVLCMTASLRNDLRSTLVETCGLQAFPRDLKEFPELCRQSELKRYRVVEITRDRALAKVVKALASGKKVLWVVNTVDRAQAAAHALRQKSREIRVLCYHSRFRLKDRRDRHREAVEAFQRTSDPVALVSTQVCEMSLDLDADVLVTEVAPVPSLVQRMGRCCRSAPLDGCRVGEVLVYAAQSARPYEDREIEQGQRFIRTLAAKSGVSQADLAAYLEKMESDDPFAREGYVGFLDSGFYAMSADESFREGEDWTIDAVLDTDVAEYLRLLKNDDPDAQGLIVPVPRRNASEDPRLGRSLQTAPASQYDSCLGFTGGDRAA